MTINEKSLLHTIIVGSSLSLTRTVNKTLSDTLTVSQDLSPRNITKDITHSLTVSQTISDNRTEKELHDRLIVTSTIAASVAMAGDSLVNQVIVQQTISKQVTYTRAINHVLTIEQSVMFVAVGG